LPIDFLTWTSVLPVLLLSLLHVEPALSATLPKAIAMITAQNVQEKRMAAGLFLSVVK